MAYFSYIVFQFKKLRFSLNYLVNFIHLTLTHMLNERQEINYGDRNI